MADLSPTGILTKAWNTPPVDDGEIEMTMALLVDIPFEELQHVMLQLARTHGPFRPNAATIRAAVVKSRGLFPSEGEAGRTALLLHRTRTIYAMGGSRHRFPVVHPLVRDALDAAGIDHPSSFIKAYRAAVETASRKIQEEPLDTPVVYRPIKIREAYDHVPEDLEWRCGGWWSPAGVLVHADQGGTFELEDGPASPDVHEIHLQRREPPLALGEGDTT